MAPDHLHLASVIRSGRCADVLLQLGGDRLVIVPFDRVKSASHIELARRACRIVGGTPLQRQVTRHKVMGAWLAPDESEPVKDTGGNATQEDEDNGKD